MAARPFGIHSVKDILGDPNHERLSDDGRYLRAVCEPYPGARLRAAWWVLTGRAHAIVWPTDKELDRALNDVPP